MTAPTYAANTSVPVSRSINEIENTLRRYGADAFGYGKDGKHGVVTFRLAGRMMRLAVEIPENAQHERARPSL